MLKTAAPGRERWTWEAADLSFDCRMLGSRNKLPTVEFRLDAPAELTLPHVASTADGTVEVWKYGTVILTDHIPAQMPEATTVFLLRPDGAAAVTYRAFKESVRVLTELKLPAEFSWRLCAMTYPLRLQERPQHMPMELCTRFGCAAPMMRR